MKRTTCSLDIILNKFLKEVIDTVEPRNLMILTEEIFPYSFKHDMVQPILKP